MLDIKRSKMARQVLLVLALYMVAMQAFAQNATEPPPVVTAALVPLYPGLARQAHIEGEVKLEVSTDGGHVSKVYVLSGPTMLAQAARDNVSTWHFRPDIRMKFEVTFRYKLLSVAEKLRCDGTNDNSTVLLKLPTDVEVSADELWICDPSTTIHKNR